MVTWINVLSMFTTLSDVQKTTLQNMVETAKKVNKRKDDALKNIINEQ